MRRPFAIAVAIVAGLALAGLWQLAHLPAAGEGNTSQMRAMPLHGAGGAETMIERAAARPVAEQSKLPALDLQPHPEVELATLALG